MTSSPRVALYLRQSLDSDAGAAIGRQRERCEALVAARGWTIAAEYVDNDVSASKDRGPKTGWGRMLANARNLDIVVAIDLDRLVRRIDELVVLTRAGLRVLTVDGEIDLTTADGEMRAGMLALIARFEARHKGDRQRRSNQQARDLGIPPGARRAFGYTERVQAPKARVQAGVQRTAADGSRWPDYGHEPIPEEAAVIRRGYDLLLAGASLPSIAAVWNDAGTRTTDGAQWRPVTVRAVLGSPRYAALVRPPHVRGEVRVDDTAFDLSTVTDGGWEPIVDRETWHAAQGVLRDPGRKTSPAGARRKWLLSGLATCGVEVDGRPCGALIRSAVTAKRTATGTRRTRAYRCSGHGHLSRQAVPVDELVVAVTLARLARPDAAALLEHHDAPDRSALQAEYRAKRARQDSLVGLYTDGLMTEAQYREAARRLGSELLALQDRMRDPARADVLAPLVDATDVQAAWDVLPVDQQRAVVAALMSVEMLTPGPGWARLEAGEERLRKTAETVRITWR